LCKSIPASAVVLDCICEAWPSATVKDLLRDFEHEGDTNIEITRTADIHGIISIELSVVPDWPEEARMWPRGLQFEFGYEPSMRAVDPLVTTSFSVTTHEGDSTPDWAAVTDLRTIEEVSAVAARFVAAFRGDRLYHAISVEDDAHGGHLAATPISDADAEEDKCAADLVSGDLVCVEMGSSALEALEAVKKYHRVRSLVLKEMLDRGIALEAETAVPTFG
jgi:hypothetical protein